MKTETHVHDLLANERPLEYAFVEKHIPKHWDGFLDVGCAHGQILAKYPDAVGLDWSENPAYVDRMVHGNVLELTRIFDCKFDVITCISTLEHVGMGHYGDPVYYFDPSPVVFSQLLHVLRPRGTLLITIPLEFFHPKSVRFMAPNLIPNLCRMPRIKLIHEHIYLLHNTPGSVKTLGCYHIHKGA